MKRIAAVLVLALCGCRGVTAPAPEVAESRYGPGKPTIVGAYVTGQFLRVELKPADLALKDYGHTWGVTLQLDTRYQPCCNDIVWEYEVRPGAYDNLDVLEVTEDVDAGRFFYTKIDSAATSANGFLRVDIPLRGIVFNRVPPYDRFFNAVLMRVYSLQDGHLIHRYGMGIHIPPGQEQVAGRLAP